MVRWTLRRDRRHGFAFAPLQGPTAQAIVKRHRDVADADSLVVVRNRGTSAEQAFVRSDAVLAVARELGTAWRILARLSRVIPRRMRDAIYDLVARHRYRTFGRYDACPVPAPSLRDRFLD